MSTESGSGEVRFAVSSVDCIACTPAFREGLKRSAGVKDVRALPMLNMMVVKFDPSKTREPDVKDDILGVAAKSGFKGMVVFANERRR
ncbi:MAG: hypothetical protein JRM73_01360 [Nitrososphaerota archaeon]|nr:hypothetical protein [Nitrososphaerota archaeon]